MKKIKFLLVALIGLTLFAPDSYGQASYTVQTYTLTGVTAQGVVKARDTTTNTDTTVMEILGVNGLINGDGSIMYNSDVTIYWTNTQISGTTGGSVIVQGSEDGVFAFKGSWVTLATDKVQYTAAKDTVTVSGTTSAYFVLASCKWKFIRVLYISSGTQTSCMTGKAWVRRRD